ncbi:MAG: 4'-phosphopantetheinyl transferase superfamily protein [Candidatus Omnitrophota bacterium]
MFRVGVDIADVKQMKRIIARDGQETFLKKVFTRNEIMRSRKVKNKARYFSQIFIFKESFVKAKGCGFSNLAQPTDIEVQFSILKPLSGNCKNRIKAYFKKQKINLINVYYQKLSCDTVSCSLIVDID